MQSTFCKMAVIVLLCAHPVFAKVLQDYELRNGDIISEAWIKEFTATGVILQQKSGKTKEYRIYEFSNKSRITILTQFFSSPEAPYYGMAYAAARDARKMFLKSGMRPLKDGIYVAEVGKNSPAAKAGIRKGDVIVRWGSRRVHSMLSFYYAVQATRNDEEIPITIKRWNNTGWRTREVVLDPLTPEELRVLEHQRRLAEQRERERRRRLEEERRRGPIHVHHVSSLNFKEGRELIITVKNTGNVSIKACKFEVIYLDAFGDRVSATIGVYDESPILPGRIQIITIRVPKNEFIRKAAVRPIQCIDSNGKRWFGRPEFKIANIVRLR